MYDILPMQSDWMRESLVLGFVSLGVPECETRAKLLLRQFDEGKITLDGIFAAKLNDKIVGVIFSQKKADGTVIIWPPGTVFENGQSDRAKAVRTALWRQMNEHVERIPNYVAIIFVEKLENVDRSELENAGFDFLSELQYLVAQETTFPMEIGRNPVAFVPLANDPNPETIDPARFGEMVSLVDHTYKETRDFPQLSGIAPTAEILRGYQYEGTFRPDLWFFIQVEGRNVGVLILTEQDDKTLLELTYMGLVPEERGKRFGGPIVQYVLWKARQIGRQLVVVSVDAQNEPAVKSYKRSGFQIWDSKYLFVRFCK